MNDRFPRFVSRLRIFVPLAVLVMILGGASAAFAGGAFESNGSGFDSPRDVAERGAVGASTTTTTLPDANDATGDKRVDAAPPTQNQSTPGPAASDDRRDDNPGLGSVDDGNSGRDRSNSGHGRSRHSSDD